MVSGMVTSRGSFLVKPLKTPVASQRRLFLSGSTSASSCTRQNTAIHPLGGSCEIWRLNRMMKVASATTGMVSHRDASAATR